MADKATKRPKARQAAAAAETVKLSEEKMRRLRAGPQYPSNRKEDLRRAAKTKRPPQAEIDKVIAENLANMRRAGATESDISKAIGRAQKADTKRPHNPRMGQTKRKHGGY